MADVLRPASTEEVRAAVAEAAASGTPLAPAGSGSRGALGAAVEHRRLDLSGLAGVTLYEPEELVMTARAGTPLDEIARMLDQRGQELAFEPPMTNRLWGEDRPGTLGGLLMTALSGPRRIKAGAVRDHVLGITAVSGRGEVFKAGGRVVKNVTGYDVAKGLAGSFGTLAVATEITVKVLPKAETAATLVLHGLDETTAVATLCEAMGAPVDVSGAAHLPAAAARAAGFDGPATVVRLEGVAPSVDERATRLAGLLAGRGAAERLGPERTAALWAAIRDLRPLEPLAEDEALWRVSVKPTAGPSILAAAGARRAMLDWSGGLAWLVTDAAAAAHDALAIRAAVAAAGGGHATLVRAPAEVRRNVAVFQPQPAPLAALSRRLKAGFDPMNILNPGRMGEGL